MNWSGKKSKSGYRAGQRDCPDHSLRGHYGFGGVRDENLPSQDAELYRRYPADRGGSGGELIPSIVKSLLL